MTAVQWVILLVVVAVAVYLGMQLSRRRRSGQLRDQFGPEYDRLVADRDGNRRDVEAELAERAKRRERLDVKELDPADRDRYAESWRKAQLRFLDEPETAVVEADRLVGEVMRARGYPVDDFEQQAADLSVDHPIVVQNYRAGHEIATRHATGQASTEDLRQGMIHYRALVEELLGLEATGDGHEHGPATGATTDAAEGPDAADRAAAEPRTADAGERRAQEAEADKAEADKAEADKAEADKAEAEAADRRAAERDGRTRRTEVP